MVLVVNATPLSPANNSYVSLADAAEYVSTRVSDTAVSDAWLDLDEADQAKYLINASRALDTMCNWIGDRYIRDQGLKWPRINAVVDGWLIDSVTFPRQVVEATIEFALWLMTNGGAVSTTSNTQFDSIKVGPIAIDFNEGSGTPTQSFYPDVVAALLKDLGGITPPDLPSNTMIRQVHLVRA